MRLRFSALWRADERFSQIFLKKFKKGIDKPKEMRYNIQAHPKRGRGRDTETDELVESFFKKLKKGLDKLMTVWYNNKVARKKREAME